MFHAKPQAFFRSTDDGFRTLIEHGRPIGCDVALMCRCRVSNSGFNRDVSWSSGLSSSRIDDAFDDVLFIFLRPYMEHTPVVDLCSFQE